MVARTFYGSTTDELGKELDNSRVAINLTKVDEFLIVSI